MNYTKTIREFCLQNKGDLFDVSYMKDKYFEMVPYKVLLASLDKYERKLFENRIMKSKAIRFSVKEERIAFSIIFDNWQEICFPGRQYQLKTITKEQVGEKIKALRISSGYTRKQVADITGISEATLKAYENGDRMMRFDVAFLLMQVYGVAFDEFL